jgi:hypothetical protein
MKKLKLYLDTSIISYLDQEDAPDKMAETRLLRDKIKDIMTCSFIHHHF